MPSHCRPSHTAVCPSGGSERSKCLILSDFRAQGSKPSWRFCGVSSYLAHPRKEWRKLPADWWRLRVQPSGKAALSPPQPSRRGSPLWPSSQDVGCQVVPASSSHSPPPALLTKAGLSGAEQGRPMGRAGAPHHTLSLRKRTGLVQGRGCSPCGIPPLRLSRGSGCV